jgi:HK97 family phage major capsid protein
MTAREKFEDALRERGLLVKVNSAQCPAHPDGSPSLSIGDRRDGKGFVLKCHGGCDYQDVLSALGMSPPDLFDDDGMRGIYAPKRDYGYPCGRVVHRKPDKSFPQSNTKGNSLFHADRIGDAQTVYWPEGEKDVEAIEAVGGVAVCSAMGAGKADLADVSPLRGKHVIVVADKDGAGREHARQVAELLTDVAASVRIVEAADGKDAADHIAADKTLDEFVGDVVDGDNSNPEADDDETVRTVPWPTLSNAALHGIAGKIVNLVAPHTEADPAAILVQLLSEFGATLGAEPHFVAGNDRHQAIINPLIVGRTNNGAKGTGLAVVEAIRKLALPWFDEFTSSGLSSAEGLIELVRDPSGEPDDNDYDPGVADKRLPIKESEYKSVLVRMRREGNTLGPTLRDTFDCRPLRTLTRKHNKLTATGAHIVVIGHVTPGEFRATLQDSDLSGGTVNRMLICLSRRSSQGRVGAQARGHDAYSDRQHSYVRDLISSVTPAVDTSGEGRQRLGGLETRNVTGLTSSTAFDPPQYLLDLYARVSRPNAPLYSLLNKVALESPVVQTPKITAGNTAAAQSAENATISTTQWTDEYITVTPKTYAAASYVSDQALTLSPVELDGLIFSDLFASLAVSIENAVLYDAAFGLDTLAASTGVTFATGSSDTADVLASFAHALNVIATTRYNTSNVIAITHPSVILHQTSHVDTTGRPIYLGDHGFNPAGIPGPVNALGQNIVPALTIQGVPVYSDANVVVAGNAAPIYFIKLDDSFVSEFGPSSLASPHTAALQIAWLLRTHSILGVKHRYPEALVKVTGFTAATTGFGGS